MLGKEGIRSTIGIIHSRIRSLFVQQVRLVEEGRDDDLSFQFQGYIPEGERAQLEKCGLCTLDVSERMNHTCRAGKFTFLVYPTGELTSTEIQQALASKIPFVDDEGMDEEE